MVHQVDLHAADVDAAYAVPAQLPHRADGGGLGGEKSPVALGSYGPWPGNSCPLPAPPAARFGDRDGAQHRHREPARTFRRARRIGAGHRIVRRDRPRPRLVRRQRRRVHHT